MHSFVVPLINIAGQLCGAPNQLRWSTASLFKPKSRLSFERTLHRKNGYKGVVPQATGSSILQERPLTFSIFQINPSHTVCGIGLTGHSPRSFSLTYCDQLKESQHLQVEEPSL